MEQRKSYMVVPVCDISVDKSLQGDHVADNHCESIALVISNQRSRLLERYLEE